MSLCNQCDGDDPFEDNYEDFCNLDSTRLALHVGDIEFSSGDVYGSMLPVIMTDSVEDVELCLENYRSCFEPVAITDNK